MRYIILRVTPEDRERIQKRKEGDEKFKDGVFGHVELMRRLLEVSPNCKSASDLTQLLRISRKLEKIENDEAPVLEIPEDEFSWVKKILEHNDYQKYGPAFVRIFSEILEAIFEAKTELGGHIGVMHLAEKEPL